MDSMEYDVSEALKCQMCSKMFSQPVQMPCGETVCKMHFSSLNGDRTVKCELCMGEHEIPEEGFPENRAIQRMIQMSLNKLDSDSCHFYKNARISFGELFNKLKLFESIQNDPNNLIEGYFSDLIHNIKTSRSDLHKEIDDYYDKLLEDMQLNMNECIRSSEYSKSLTSDELFYFQNEVSKAFKMSDLNETKWKDIEIKTKIQINKIGYVIKETINQLLLNKSYKFKSPEVQFNYMNVQSVENFNSLNEHIMKINESLEKRLEEGVWKKYKLIDYDDIKYDITEQHLNQLEADDQIKSILMDPSQIEHLNLIKRLESDSKQIKHYVFLRNKDSNVQNNVIMSVVYKNYNLNYAHEFINKLGFIILIKTDISC